MLNVVTERDDPLARRGARGPRRLRHEPRRDLPRDRDEARVRRRDRVAGLGAERPRRRTPRSTALVAYAPSVRPSPRPVSVGLRRAPGARGRPDRRARDRQRHDRLRRARHRTRRRRTAARRCRDEAAGAAPPGGLGGARPGRGRRRRRRAPDRPPRRRPPGGRDRRARRRRRGRVPVEAGRTRRRGRRSARRDRRDRSADAHAGSRPPGRRGRGCSGRRGTSCGGPPGTPSITPGRSRTGRRPTAELKAVAAGPEAFLERLSGKAPSRWTQQNCFATRWSGGRATST